MPFDGKEDEYDPHAIMRAKLDAMPPRQLLSWLAGELKKPLPAGFTWNYRQYSSCAIGLYAFHTGRDADDVGDEAAEIFGISDRRADHFFRNNKDIVFGNTPRRVAGRINRYLFLNRVVGWR